MTLFVTHGDSAEATGHPSSCAEPVSGSVQGSSRSLTITTAGGTTASVATKQSTIHFDSHAHQYSDTDNDGSSECHDYQSHDLTGSDLNDSKLSSSLTHNGNPIMVNASGVATDPGSGGDVNVSAGTNNSVEET